MAHKVVHVDVFDFYLFYGIDWAQNFRALLTCIKRLRRRLKNLKRGLPIDDTAPISRPVSMNSMSPPGPSYSTVPPPAKRHQTSHPRQFEYDRQAEPQNLTLIRLLQREHHTHFTRLTHALHLQDYIIKVLHIIPSNE